MAETFRLWSYNKLPRCLLWFVWFRKYLVFPCDLWKSLCGIWLLLLSGDNGKGWVALEYENHKPCLPGWAWPKKSGALSRVIYESLVSMIHGWSLKVWNVSETVSVLFTSVFVEVHQEGGQVFWTDLGDYVGISKRSINVKERSP